ncbi:MAG: pentapeptide repeat-containing protein [Armatimonadetes bacterium]|nr:pentapeptide repeat-containing protein [Armatimonadota bacterium]
MPVQLKEKEETQTATYTSATPPVPKVQIDQAASVETLSPTLVVANPPRRAKRSFVRPAWTRFVKRERFSAAAVFVVCGLAIVLGVSVGWLFHGWGQIIAGLKAIQVDGKSAVIVLGPPTVQVVAGAIAGLVALWQFNRSHWQRDMHLVRAQRLAKRQADQKERTDRELARQKELVDREHFRSKELQDQFGDIQNRLASPEPIIRANAALRLAQFGETLKPGVAEGELRTEKNNPYFVPVVSQLATALYLEPNPAIRKAIREAFKNLIAFANTDGDDQPLLHALIERLADANRTARDNFIKALAEWTVINKDWIASESEDAQTAFTQDGECYSDYLKEKIFQFLCSVAPFCYRRDATESVLEYLIVWGEQIDSSNVVERDSLFTIQRRKYEQKREAQGDAGEKSKGDAMLLPTLETTAQQLIDTRDSLADSLRSLKLPTDFPVDLHNKMVKAKECDCENEGELIDYGISIRKVFDRFDVNEGWKRPNLLNLTSCFLAGAILDESIMSGGMLNYCFLQGASMASVRLEGASMYYVKMGYALVSGGDFIGADIRRADLYRLGADFANLMAVDLSFTNLVEINPNGINLTCASLYGVHIDRLTERRLPYGTNLKNFCPIFRSYIGTVNDNASDTRTNDIKEWLTELKCELQSRSANLNA